MKKYILASTFLLSCLAAKAQITVTASDMPVNGDTLRYSVASPLGSGINLNDTGANKTWNFDTLKSTAQRVDEYKSALQVNLAYALISLTAYGYKVTDTLGIPGVSLPVNITEVYNFFSKKNGPSRFVAEGFGAKIAGIPTPSNYSDEDEWYFFPLAYGNYDSSHFNLKLSLPSVGSLTMDGDRKTKVDGWGTITTPFYTTAKACIRVKSEIDEVDSLKLGPLPATGIPRKTIEYKWLVNGDHYPALWVTTTVVANIETITAIRYRDKYIPASVQQAKAADISTISIYPNPANAGYVTVDIPNSKEYVIELFNVQGKLMNVIRNNNKVDVTGLSSGNYIIRVSSDKGIGYGTFVK